MGKGKVKRKRENWAETVFCNKTKSGVHEYFVMTGRCLGCGRYKKGANLFQKDDGGKP